jgi:RNA-directed DNA polymerase
MSLETPKKDPDASEKATFEAKDEPTYRFYLLYDKIYRQDILAYAYELAKSNQDAPGVDLRGD